jgi:hypothetical protein
MFSLQKILSLPLDEKNLPCGLYVLQTKGFKKADQSVCRDFSCQNSRESVGHRIFREKLYFSDAIGLRLIGGRWHDSDTRGLWEYPHVWVVYLLLLPTLAIFAAGFYKRARLWLQGSASERFNRWSERIWHLVKLALFQQKVARSPLVGAAHAPLFWSMGLLFVGTLVVMICADLRIPIMQGTFYLVFQSQVLDIAGAVGIFALSGALVHQYWLKPTRLAPNRPGAAPA